MRWLAGQSRLLLIAACIACVALIVSLAFAGITVSSRQASIGVTCAQVKKVRTDLVAVLVAARDISLTQGRPSQYTDAQEAERQNRIRAFYAPQLARVRPISCP